MDIWRDIRLKARQRHELAAGKTASNLARDLVRAGLKDAGLQVDEFDPGSVFGPGVLGALEREDGFVRLASDLADEQRPVVIAHELGHYWLHDESAYMIRSTEAGFGGQPMETGANHVVAYSPRQRQEVQADIFAQEFLLPADRLREKFVAHQKKPSEIAAEAGLPIGFVRMQAIRALLLPPLETPVPSESGGSRQPLDPEQVEAAEWDERPLILDAGPGTGKTRTLIARIEHLLKNGVPPSTILALTYSNKAAGEMIERVETVDAAASPLIWVGTFHAFGLELLRLHSEAAALPPGFQVLDETDGLALLESILAELPLVHFQNLWDPSLELRPILRAISRAKDEMVSDVEYMDAAEAGLRVASTIEEIERAERAVEVGRVYRIYTQALRDRGCVDFGDLVYLAAKLLGSSPEIRAAVREKHRHILVDEYQDVNFASTSLLKHLTEEGKRLWVVADPRQSIYRFRGAAPGNAAEFTSRYAGAERRRLKTNYRSCESVVRVFEKYGADIVAAPKPAATWKAHRGRVGHADLVRAPDLRSEAVAMRDKIERLRNEGIQYGDQAILASTHLCLARFGKMLEDLGVPVLYLGDLFERSEIRDLLALCSLGADRSGVGLVRVAQFLEYGATREDAVRIVAFARETEQDVLTVCANAAAVPGLSAQGIVGLGLLARHLAGVAWKTSCWHLLTTYLLEISEYLRPLLNAGDVRSQQSLVAIYLLLKFCREHVDGNKGEGGRLKLLDDIRRLERLDDDRQFRIVPPEAAGIAAVRMMTVHASKGLEFRAVHLPQVATRYVPGRTRPSSCPPPLGLERLEVSAAEQKAEAECLFFVALSRARDVLVISSADRYTEKQTVNPSKFLDGLLGVLPPARAVSKASAPGRPPEIVRVATKAEHEERHLDIYAKCPARYRYEVIDGLRGHGDDSAFLKFHSCVRATVRWIYEELGEGREVDVPRAKARFGEVWAARGPVHAFEPVYFAEAVRMVEGAVVTRVEGIEGDRVWTAQLAGKRIVTSPDRVVVQPSGGILAQKVKTGRQSKSESSKPVWGLMQLAASQMYPGRPVQLEAFYPGRGARVVMAAAGDAKAVASYVDSVAGIERGLFEPKAGRDCPTCPFYFVCTSEDSF